VITFHSSNERTYVPSMLKQKGGFLLLFVSSLPDTSPFYWGVPCAKDSFFVHGRKSV
jgi:hypothetical protein